MEIADDINSQKLFEVTQVSSQWEKTPFSEIKAGVQSILPLVIFLMIVLFIILKSIY